MICIGAVAGHHRDAHGRRSRAGEIQLAGRDRHFTDIFDARLHGRGPVLETAAAEAVADSRCAVEIGAHHRAARHVVPGAVIIGKSGIGPARHQEREAHNIAPVHRKAHHLFGIDGVGELAGRGVHHRRLAAQDRDRLRRASECERGVDVRHARGLHLDRCVGFRRKARLRND